MRCEYATYLISRRHDEEEAKTQPETIHESLRSDPREYEEHDRVHCGGQHERKKHSTGLLVEDPSPSFSWRRGSDLLLIVL